MRMYAPLMALGAALIFGFSSSAVLAQDQPAAGAPPPAATSQAPSPDAQTNPAPDAQTNPAPNPQRQARRMARELALTPEQQSQIEPILADRQQQLESARADATLPPRDKRAKVWEINQNSDARIEAILSDTQKQQYEQMKEQQRANRQMRQQQPPSVPPAASNL